MATYGQYGTTSNNFNIKYNSLQPIIYATNIQEITALTVTIFLNCT